MKSIRHRFTFIRSLVAFSVVCLFGACANSQAPSGGPPDKEPPEITEFTPNNGTLNFREEYATLRFSEYVNKSKVAENVYLSPPKRLEYSWSGREVEITFAEPLDSNTTYALTLGTEYEDLSNNKPAQAFTLIFSTGNHLDSGIIHGKLTSDAPSGVFIFLYPLSGINPDTLNPETTKPKYRTQVGTSGTFEFRALPAGKYRMFAIKDEYKDQLYSVGIDGFGAPLSDIQLRQDSIPTINLRLGVAVDNTRPQLYDVKAIDPTIIEVTFSEDIDTASLTQGNYILRDSSGQIGVTTKAVWMNHKNGKSVFLSVAPALDTAVKWKLSIRLGDTTVRDLAGNPIADTVASKLFRIESEHGDTAAIPTLRLPFPDSSKSVGISTVFDILFDRAVIHDDVDRRLVFTNLSTNKTVLTNDEWRGDNLLRLTPQKPLDSDNWYEFKLSTGGIRALGSEAAMKDSVRYMRFKTVDVRTFGGVKGTLIDSATTGNERYVVSLVGKDKKNRINLTVKNVGAFEFTEIPPGIYTLEAFVDTEKTGKYYYGSAFPFRPSSRFGASAAELTVRSRWTVEGAKVEIAK
ncbi:MAG: Ig-like domain-containing protein [Ignavibacteria bacterium]|nr:Ig-like domain-containing protein [Ignavibacteria bacterium]